MIEPGRRVRFDLDREAAELILLPGQEVIGNAETAILTVLADAHANDVESLKRKALIDEVFHRFKRSASTVDNTIPGLLRRRLIVRPRRGYFALSPAESQSGLNVRRDASIDPPYIPLPLTPGRNSPNSIATTGDLELPDDCPTTGQSGNSAEHPLEPNCPPGNSGGGIGQSQNAGQDWLMGQKVPDGIENTGIRGPQPAPGWAGASQSHAAATEAAPVETDSDDDDREPWDD